MTREELEKETDVTPISRGSGPGGQHRNKVATGVLLTHKPTGLVARATERSERSQNLSVAFKRLAAVVEEARKPDVPRVAMKVSRRQKAKRLDDKSKRSQTKQFRKKPQEE